METNSAAVEHGGFTLGELASRAFLAAHLLTADAREAQRATVEGINSWNCDEETGDVLFQKVLLAATRSFPAARANIGEREGDRAYLPSELRRVLTLPSGLRQCFVLHVLAALPLPDCARMLQLHSRQVIELLLAAYNCLSVLDPTEDFDYESFRIS
jgi:hypothetical protein